MDSNGKRPLVVLAVGLLAACTATVRQNVSSSGAQTTGSASGDVSISADGRYIAFTGPVPGGSINTNAEVMVRDTKTGTTEVVSKAADGSAANGGSYITRISGDGRYVAFLSEATNLDLSATYSTNATSEVFVHDRSTGTTRLISRQGNEAFPLGTALWGLSADGRYVLFVASGTLYLADRMNGTVTQKGPSTSQCPAGYSPGAGPATMTPDATRIAYSQYCGKGTASLSRAVVLDAKTGDASVVGEVAVYSTPGTQRSVWRLSFSADGSVLIWTDQLWSLDATDGHVWVWTGGTTSTQLATGPDAREVALSGDGRYLAYSAAASQDNALHHIYVLDRTTHTMREASVAMDGGAPNGQSYQPAISADGKTVAFASSARNLVPGDTNGTIDVFTRPIGAVFGPTASASRT